MQLFEFEQYPYVYNYKKNQKENPGNCESHSLTLAPEKFIEYIILCATT